MKKSADCALKWTNKLLRLAKNTGYEEVRIVENKGCSHDLSYDLYFTMNRHVTSSFDELLRDIALLGIKLGEYRNEEELCVTVIGANLFPGKYKLVWTRKP